MAFTLTGKSYGKAIADIEHENEKNEGKKRTRRKAFVRGEKMPKEEEVRRTIPDLSVGARYRFDRLRLTAGESKHSFEMYFCSTEVLSGGRPLYLFRRGVHVGLESFTEQQMLDHYIEEVRI